MDESTRPRGHVWTEREVLKIHPPPQQKKKREKNNKNKAKEKKNKLYIMKNGRTAAKETIFYSGQFHPQLLKSGPNGNLF